MIAKKQSFEVYLKNNSFCLIEGSQMFTDIGRDGNARGVFIRDENGETVFAGSLNNIVAVIQQSKMHMPRLDDFGYTSEEAEEINALHKRLQATGLTYEKVNEILDEKYNSDTE